MANRYTRASLEEGAAGARANSEGMALIPVPNLSIRRNTTVKNEINHAAPKLSKAQKNHILAIRASQQKKRTAQKILHPAQNIPSQRGNEQEGDEILDEKRFNELAEESLKCKETCKLIDDELNRLSEIKIKNNITGITLPTNSKLIHLLIHRILDPSPDWKQKIDMLIRIPHSLKGEYLRGGDYFEALFQLALAINILPMFSGKFIHFYDIKNYKELEEVNNYLYIKPIKNSGGSEQGISDISFKVCNQANDCETITRGVYECGEKPIEVSGEVPFYFISVKGYKKEKNIAKYYDIPLLDQQINIFPLIKNKYIMVCVRDKEKFLQNLSRTKAEFLKNSIGNRVIGFDNSNNINDMPDISLMDAFSQFRVSFFNKLQGEPTIENISELAYRLFPENVIQKPMLSLYFHQELVSTAVINRIIEKSSSEKPHFLCIGVLPRGGKSFIAGGIINLHKQIKIKTTGYNILFMTSAVNETRDQFKRDLIEKFSDFADFDFIDVVNIKRENEYTKPNKFYFISRQLSSLRGKEEALESEDKSGKDIAADLIRTLENKLKTVPSFDICFFDEAHVGILSTTVRSNFQKTFERFKLPIIMMTATYVKPANLLDSTKDLFVWDLQDIKDMKTLPVLGLNGFIESKPDLLIRYDTTIDDTNMVEKILRRRISRGEDEITIAKPYIQFPNPNFISLTFAPETIANLIRTGDGYEYTRAFELNVDPSILKDNSKYREWGSMIQNRPDALKIRQFLTPEQESVDEILTNKNRKFRALNQIFSISQKNASRPYQGKPFSILMFLPFGFGEKGRITKIGELCRVWASFMMESNYWRDNFVFLTLSELTYPDYRPLPDITFDKAAERGICHREDFDGDLKNIILGVERAALKIGKGLVILSGDVAKMGISLKCVDVVFMMTNNDDADDIIQKMYRALTDDPPNKKDGFIVDLNLKRVISAMLKYDLEKDRLRTSLVSLPSTGERINKLFELCNWGQDAFIEDHPEKSFNDVMDEIRNRVVSELENKQLSSFDDNIKKIRDLQIKKLMEDAPLYNLIKEVIGQTTTKKRKQTEKEIILERGSAIPAISKSVVLNKDVNAEDEDINIEEVKPAKKIILNEAEIKKKIQDIILTFINSLVIKSSEPWTKNLNLVFLLEKYRNDKLSFEGIPNCNCSSMNECKKNHTNLYEAVFCELRSYAMIPNIKGNPEYNLDIHIGILDLISEVFRNPSIIVEWNMYIENLLKQIDKTNRYVGGYHHTRKKNRG
jgi:hypothetical protein